MSELYIQHVFGASCFSKFTVLLLCFYHPFITISQGMNYFALSSGSIVGSNSYSKIYEYECKQNAILV